LGKILQLVRFLSIFGIIVIYLIVNGTIGLIVRDRWRQTYIWSHILTILSRMILFVFGGKVNVIGYENYKKQTGALLAGNHTTYLDVMCIASMTTTCFVTSVEIKETPGLGLLCRMAGCLFVERRNRANLQNEIGELREGLERGMTVTIFPEATSTNGEQILRFRRPLFLSAVHAKKAVVPVCLNYRVLGKEKLSLQNRDSIFWYGDMDFLPHLWKLCGLGNIEIDMHFLDPIVPSENEDGTELAAKSQLAVESVFIPVKP
jgi:1-acyl-sn-glycerol-3-phosphate acyltransferase